MSTPSGPWDHWIPGALSKNQVKQLYKLGLIRLNEGDLDIGACSIDLTLADEGFLMEMGSVKPATGSRYRDELKVRLEKCGDSYLLKRRKTYVFPLRERLTRSLGEAGFYGQATAKSSIGRLDVLARLIVDGMDTYECFDAERLKKASGMMYLEITPITFDIRVRAALSLTQLRLFYGRPEDSEITGGEICKSILGSDAREKVLTLNLGPDEIGGIRVSAFCAKTDDSCAAISLWAKKQETPWKYWRFVKADAQKRLQIESEQFYILRSMERLYVPNGIAIYCEATDETIGEMRIHYTGFVHPGFGMKRKDNQPGTPLIFEVRGHQVKANLKHGEKMANLRFYRMSSYDSESLEINKSYNDQNLQLSNVFRKWPKRLKEDGRGNVEPA